MMGRFGISTDRHPGWLSVWVALAAAFAAYVVGKGTGLGRFLIVISTGIIIGSIGVVLVCFVPGGAPVVVKLKVVEQRIG